MFPGKRKKRRFPFPLLTLQIVEGWSIREKKKPIIAK